MKIEKVMTDNNYSMTFLDKEFPIVDSSKNLLLKFSTYTSEIFCTIIII